MAVERERLATAVRIERERKIVFPETSVIIHDIAKLLKAIENATSEEPKSAFDFNIDI